MFISKEDFTFMVELCSVCRFSWIVSISDCSLVGCKHVQFKGGLHSCWCLFCVNAGIVLCLSWNFIAVIVCWIKEGGGFHEYLYQWLCVLYVASC
jgi:hypothetical protein